MSTLTSTEPAVATSPSTRAPLRRTRTPGAADDRRRRRDRDPRATDGRQDHRGDGEGDHAEAGPDEARDEAGHRRDRDRRRRREGSHPGGPPNAERDQGTPARHQGDEQRDHHRDRPEDHHGLPSPEVTRLATGPDTAAEDTVSAAQTPRTGPPGGGAMVAAPG